jgi:hypothetical protein
LDRFEGARAVCDGGAQLEVSTFSGDIVISRR